MGRIIPIRLRVAPSTNHRVTKSSTVVCYAGSLDLYNNVTVHFKFRFRRSRLLISAMVRDKCADFGCNNDRSHPERNIIKEHVKQLKFHGCPKKFYSRWTKLLGWKNYKVTNTTAVCSNHFKHGEPFSIDPHPTLYLRGYDTKAATSSKPRPPPKRRSEGLPPVPSKPRKIAVSKGKCKAPKPENVLLINGHDYTPDKVCNCNQLTCIRCARATVAGLQERIRQMEATIHQTDKQLEEARATIQKLEKSSSKNCFSISDVSTSDNLIKMYTGLPSYALFQWVLNEVKPHAVNMRYYRGNNDSCKCEKQYQLCDHERPGQNRVLSLKDELFLTLMKLRLNLNQQDLAVRFNISQTTVSRIISTWVPFLAHELEHFIYWPTREQILKYYPSCFHSYEGCVRCIIDCTEIKIQRPSLAVSNNHVYSQYKFSPTLKVLVGITPGGTISFLSKPVCGPASDKEMVKITNLIDLLEEGDILLADRGFNIQELLLQHQVKLIIPPFTRTTSSINQFTEGENSKTKLVANSRIHVERAIGRLKEFMLLQGPIALNMVDMMEAALIVCAVIVNLQPVLVPLHS